MTTPTSESNSPEWYLPRFMALSSVSFISQTRVTHMCPDIDVESIMVTSNEAHFGLKQWYDRKALIVVLYYNLAGA